MQVEPKVLTRQVDGAEWTDCSKYMVDHRSGRWVMHSCGSILPMDAWPERFEEVGGAIKYRCLGCFENGKFPDVFIRLNEEPDARPA